MKPPSIVIDHFLSTKWSKKLFTINHYELQNGKCIVTQELSAYLVEAFFAWAKEIQSKNQLSRGKTLDGINYCINQEASLKAFLEDGDIPMDNNATESALRSFCLHKHTWKLIDSLDGANASAIIYSITETAKANNLNPSGILNMS